MDISLMITVIAAFATPMILARFNIKLLPTSVAEIIVGIIIGKSCLNLVHIDSILTSMSTFGVILLLFLSGMEIDFSLFKKNNVPLTKLEQKQADDTPKITPVQVAVLAYALSFVAAFALAFLFKFTGLFTNVLLATILFSTIALGVVISVLKENELLSKPFGQTILLIAVLGEVVPLLSLTIYSSVVAGRGSQIWLIGLLFIAGAMIFRHFRWFFPALSKFNKSTTQIDMRLSFAVIITLVVLAEHVGAENILGAFVAGIVIKLFSERIHAAKAGCDRIRLFDSFLLHPDRSQARHSESFGGSKDDRSDSVVLFGVRPGQASGLLRTAAAFQTPKRLGRLDSFRNDDYARFGSSDGRRRP